MKRQSLFPSDNLSYRQENGTARLALISAFFFIGCVLGAFFGTNSSMVFLKDFGILSLTSEANSFGTNLLLLTWFHFLALLLGTSFLGVALIPLLTLLKGFVLSCASATIITVSAPQGIIMSLIILGIPSLFFIPAFFALGDNSFSQSAKLLSLARGDTSVLGRQADKRVLIFIPLLTIGVIVDFKLIPYLLRIIS